MPENTQISRYEALAAADGLGFCRQPASVLVETGPDGPILLAADTPDQVDRHPAAGHARRVPLPRHILIPGLVNTHTHLDLTHIGPRPHDPAAGFVNWVRMVQAERLHDPEAIRASVKQGIALMRAGGTVAVGDIAGAVQGRPSLAAFEALSGGGLMGVSFIEFFAIGQRREAATQAILSLVPELRSINARTPPRGIRAGLQPHAPNTVDRRAYEAVAACGLPICTHLAESPEECEFIAQARGPQRKLLEDLGIWDSSVLETTGHGGTPIGHLSGLLRRTPMAAVHVNACDDMDLELLASTGTPVVYCPRASAYFGAERHFGPHRYRDMLRAGINVALGTDSIINLPGGSSGSGGSGISVLDEMRLLHGRDGADPATLLRMATVHGAQALGLDMEAFAFTPGHPVAGLVAVSAEGTSTGLPPLVRILKSRHPAQLLFDANGYCLAEKNGLGEANRA